MDNRQLASLGLATILRTGRVKTVRRAAGYKCSKRQKKVVAPWL